LRALRRALTAALHSLLNQTVLTVRFPGLLFGIVFDAIVISFSLFTCVYGGQKYVLKQMQLDNDRIQGRDMYLKELRLLESLRGHPNVVDI